MQLNYAKSFRVGNPRVSSSRARASFLASEIETQWRRQPWTGVRLSILSRAARVRHSTTPPCHATVSCCTAPCPSSLRWHARALPSRSSLPAGFSASFRHVAIKKLGFCLKKEVEPENVSLPLASLCARL